MFKRLHRYLLPYQPYKILFGSIPSIADAPRRWAGYQVVLSCVFFVTAIGVGFLTVDISRVGGSIMAIAIFLFALGALGLLYAIGIGLYWFNSKPTPNTNNNDEIKRAERDDRLHEDIQSLIKQIAELTQKMGNKNGK